MKRTIADLPQKKQRELKQVVAILRKIEEEGIDKIILYGSYARGDYKLERGKERGKKSDFDILVVVDTDDNQDKLELELYKNLFAGFSAPVEVIVETIGNVNFALRQSQFFFSDIIKEGIVLYDGGYYEFATPKVMNGVERKKLAENDFDEWFKEANESWKDAESAINRKSLKRASFHLQQTVEMCYTTIEMVFTHYNPYEHKLSVLRERVAEFDPRILKFLPINNEEEKELFEQLDFAYIGGRYRSEEDFPVTQKQLDYWSREAEKILAFTEKICKQKIADFGKGDFFELKRDL